MKRVEAEPETLLDLLEERCSADPERTVYTLLDGESEAGRLTCGELWQRSRDLAAALQARCAPGDRVLLLYPTGLEFIVALFGCVAAGLVAVPAPPPDPVRRRRTLPRLVSMVRDAEPSLVLAERALLEGLDGLLAEAPELAALPWTSLGDEASARRWTRPEIDGTGLAYLQYTSGSTAGPKGVMVTHGNLLDNSRRIRHAWRYGPDSIDLSWVPNFHDDGLVHGIVQPLYCGGRSYLMEPAAFVGRPVRWLRAISRFRATHSGGPDFAYAMCARKVTEPEREGLDLRSWRLAYNAAEPVRRESLEAFLRAFEPCGFDPKALFPSFGLAESTLLVTTARWDASPVYLEVDPEDLEKHHRVSEAPGRGRTLVSCGPPVPETEVAIVRPETAERCAPEEVGEIWIRSGSVAHGYFRRPEETERVFRARIRGEDDGPPYLRTGDLGFLRGGELFITGRHKDLIILRGRNVYPQDVERTAAASHPALRPGCGAAFGVELRGEERLVVVQEADDRAPLPVEEIAEEMRRRLAEEHDVPLEELALIRSRTIPKTSSGKIQRFACRDELYAGKLDVIGSWRLSSVRAGTGASRHVDELLEWLRSFAGERIDWRQVDERRSFPPHLLLELGNRGVLGLQVAPGDGGLGLTCRDFLRVLEQLGAIDLTLATFVTGHNVLGLRPVERYAPPELRRRWLSVLARGRELAAFALTEPGAGSDPRAMATTAVPDGDGWRLHGTKLWSGTAGWAGVIHVFAQLLDGDGRRSGTAGFAVRMPSPGLRLGAEAATLGLRGMVQSAIHLDGVPVSRSQLLGEPGDGMAVAEDAMLYTRLCLAAVSLGGTKRCVQLMVRYASRRSVSTGLLLENPVTLVRLTEILNEAAVLEALVAETARALDDGHPVPQEVFGALKVVGPELLWRSADALVQLLGGRGYVENNVAPRILRDARVFRIFEGPTEAIRMWLGASVDRDPRELDGFLRERLSAGGVADQVRLAVERVASRFAPSDERLEDRIAARRWMCSLLGEVATAGVLWAAAEAAGAGSEWARRSFEATVQRASSPSPGEAVRLVAEEVRRMTAGFTAGIGDFDLAEIPTDFGLDPCLARSPSAAAEAPPAAGPPRPPETGDRDVAQIESWITDWCCRELGVRPAEVDVWKPFANLGLDSVSAVALADQLGTWLERPLERTLAWQYPSIAAVSRHLAGQEPAAVPEEPEAADLRQLLAEIEGLSDEEAKAVLALERPEGGA